MGVCWRPYLSHSPYILLPSLPPFITITPQLPPPLPLRLLGLLRKKKTEKWVFFSFLFFPFLPTPTPTHGASIRRWGLGNQGLRSWKGFYFWNFNCYIFRKRKKKEKKNHTHRMKHGNCRCSCSWLPSSISNLTPKTQVPGSVFQPLLALRPGPTRHRVSLQALLSLGGFLEPSQE